MISWTLLDILEKMLILETHIYNNLHGEPGGARLRGDF